MMKTEEEDDGALSPARLDAHFDARPRGGGRCAARVASEDPRMEREREKEGCELSGKRLLGLLLPLGFDKNVKGGRVLPKHVASAGVSSTAPSSPSPSFSASSLPPAESLCSLPPAVSSQ